ncbi:MAG: hypothetical protein NTV60_01120 [Candidatus Kaiserbacteria bacterium]|nr:hypothetical protein [Candidatus Kaiserbacteria bacterium]
MKRVQVLKLGTTCEDRATGLKGTLTHWIIQMSGVIDYVFQPKGLDENGQPFKKLYLCLDRLSVKEGDFEMVDVPFEILGTQVTDKASGFNGMAIAFIRHINGCFHVDIQPKGTVPKTGAPISSHDFDLRSCTGKKIIELSKPALEKSRVEKPSPSDMPQRRLPCES